ncbi:SDR family NAD(P)-dependent oxidoreductase [Hydrogenophaga sp.]|uniref:SDR family NAD(P)-dependent oxidoreductase n=1 Tax=Hydrogenophaga sp. TaxID=1904254 RepID=UPI0008D210B5|nr:glucose 1-dehydrogenase [Hydrogenophaga sp.]OGA73575.1 MAG: oxidoreductase [Burkholderiales bacterium GWE1_65_30]OGA92069.1 MAG: oxidoreductase [Burkholderiales bacterium GWF1_66_17]OGB37155.1 MAG: oxidoreductase [Burkholderiales bacterium RIFCSPLOWO2_02_FULL_66_35]MDP3324608.1 glucose 1-dehydrogenase [Hydrogenophaga sp.]MDP3884604.1 glucose 1-dehydrogenase [Hydrogenophaga sp.]
MPSTNTPQRVAVVTGGAMGIGAEVCRRLGAAGFIVIVADRDQPAAETTAAQLRADGAAAEAQALDVGDAASVDSAFAAIEQRHGRCDVLVNSAGIAKVYPFLEFPDDNFAATMAVNVTGTFMCSQRAARLMVRNQWGRIVNIASVAGMRAVGSGRTAYGTSKGAVIALTRQMAVELAEQGVTSNAVAPGPVDTPMTRALHTEQFRREYENAIPMNRYGTVGEIAAAVMYLVSDDAGFVTGVTLPVDGGFLASGARGI